MASARSHSHHPYMCIALSLLFAKGCHRREFTLSCYGDRLVLVHTEHPEPETSHIPPSPILRAFRGNDIGFVGWADHCVLRKQLISGHWDSVIPPSARPLMRVQTTDAFRKTKCGQAHASLPNPWVQYFPSRPH